MFDKLLLLLLILLLPIGIVVSRVVTGELKVGSGLSTLQEKKIEVLVDRLNNQINQPAAAGEEINVTGVIYASDSGKLTVAGVAPKTQAFLWAWVANSKQKKPSKIASGSASVQSLWKGPLVFWPKEGGSFAIDLDVADMSGIVEVRLEQDKAKSNIRFDVEKNKQL